nr:leucine-rich repeat protein [Tanacetum cinerariifolium]
MARNTVKEMTMNFRKLDKFEGHDFRRWQKKMHFLLTTLKVVYVLTTSMPELLEDATVEAIRIRAKWENDDYICRGHITPRVFGSLTSSINSQCSQYSFERLQLDGILKGAFPADSLGRMVNLRGLRLSSNRLTGPIPESLGRLRLLEELDLSYNQLTGPIPTLIGGLAQLDLSENLLNGSIPESLGRLRLLEELDLSGNLLNGSIPESFGSLTALTYLDLSYNQLTGHVPTSPGRLVSLQLLRVRSNSLNGTVPVSIGQLTKLKHLSIYENSLEGVITEARFAKLSMLKYLLTSSNSKLTFNVSRDWKPPF